MIWIKSQDELSLIPFEEDDAIDIDTVTGNMWVIRYKHYVLGRYNTREKAVKVLDWLYDIIIENDEYGGISRKLFIPKDEEVEL